jgi:hypothetical protein
MVSEDECGKDYSGWDVEGNTVHMRDKRRGTR